MKTLLIALALVAFSPAAFADLITVGSNAPCVTVNTLHSDRSQGPRSTCAPSQAGKKVVMEFFATWCHYCMDSLPHFEAYAAKYADRADFRIMDLDENSQDALGFFAKRDISRYEVSLDSSFSSADAFGIAGTPTLVIVKDGKVQFTFEGAPTTPADFQQIESAIAQ
jgi:thiol-disulfide isomerase/thioredoxin